MQVKDRLARAGSDVDHEPVLVEPFSGGRLGDETEHPSRLVAGKLADPTERVDVPFGQDEKMGLGSRFDVADRDEAVCGTDVIAGRNELAEETVGIS